MLRVRQGSGRERCERRWTEVVQHSRPDPCSTGMTRSTAGSLVSPHKFAGEYEDQTGLYHLRARQYEPSTGRLLSRDPVAAPLRDPHVSLFAYVGNRPTVYVDPSGRSFAALFECASSPVACAREIVAAAADASGLSATWTELQTRRDRALVVALGGTPPALPETDPRCKAVAEKAGGALLIAGGVVSIGVAVFLARRIPPSATAGTNLSHAWELFWGGRAVPTLITLEGGIVAGAGIWCVQR
jgi:RHS repeat-associated protein